MKKFIIPTLLGLSLLMGGVNLFFLLKLNTYSNAIADGLIQNNQATQSLDVVVATMIELQPELKDELITRLGQPQ